MKHFTHALANVIHEGMKCLKQTSSTLQCSLFFISCLMCHLHSGVAGLTGNPTVVVPVTRHHDEALHPPASTPAAEEEEETVGRLMPISSYNTHFPTASCCASAIDR